MNYQTEALRTKSSHFFSDAVPPGALEVVSSDAQQALKLLDNIKKALFYGKTVNDHNRTYVIGSERANKADVIYPADVDLLHGIVGLATESGELLTILSHLMNGPRITTADIIDEVGDAIWYINLILTSIGSNIDEAMAGNIAKLRERFPEAFDVAKALNPNKQAESEAIHTTIAS